MMGGWNNVCPWCGRMFSGYDPTALILFGLFGLLVLAGIVLLVIWAVRSAQGGGRQGPMYGQQSEDEALRIARERYARGEITREQYDEIRESLRR